MKKIFKFYPVIILFLLGLVLSLLLYNFENNEEINEHEESLNRQLKEKVLAIENELKNIFKLLDLFEHDWNIQNDEFQMLANPVINSHDAVLSICWVEKISYSDNKNVTALFKEKGISKTFFLKELNLNGYFINVEARENYYPVLFSAPDLINQIDMKGFDFGSRENTKQAILKAEANNELVLSNCNLISLDKDIYGILAILPINRQNNINADAFIVSRMDINTLLNNTLSKFERQNLILEMFDITDSLNINQIGRYEVGKEISNSTAYNYNQTIKLANKVWKFEFKINYSNKLEGNANTFLLFGLVITTLISVYFGIWLVRKDKIKRLSKSLKREIGEKNKAEKILKEREKKFRLLYENAPLAYQSLDINGNFIDVNRAWLNSLGYRKDEVIGKHFSDFMTIKSAALVKSKFEILKNTGKVSNALFELVRHDKSVINISLDGNVSFNEDGSFKQTHCIFNDITDKIKTEKELKKNKDSLHALINATTESVFLCKNDGTVLIANVVGAKRLKTTVNEIIGKNIYDYFSEESRLYRNKKFLEVIDNKQPGFFKDSHNGLYFDNIVYPVFGENNEVISIAIYARDITFSIKAEEELKKKQYYLEKAQEIGKIGTWEIDIITNKIYWTLENYKIFGVEVGTEITYELFLNTVFYEDRQLVDSSWKKGLKSGNYSIEHRLLVNGDIKWIKEEAFVSKNDKGEIIKVLGVTQDITKQKDAEKLIKDSEEKYRAAFLTSPDAININTMDGIYIDSNEGFTKMSGYTKEEVEGVSYADINLWGRPEDREKLIKDLNQKGECSNLETLFRKKDGSLIVGLMSAKIIHLNNKPHILSITRDITKQKEIDKEILKTTIETQEQERKRFAEDLHDDLGPFLSGIKLYIKELSYKDVDYEKRLSIIEYLTEFVNSAVEKTRNISNELMPSVLTSYGLTAALESFCNKIETAAKIKVNFKSDIKDLKNENLELSLYRISTELINNTIKHADANVIDLNIKMAGDILQLDYYDDGIGFDLVEKLASNSGIGMKSILSRLELINGKYQFRTQKNEGFQFSIIVNLLKID